MSDALPDSEPDSRELWWLRESHPRDLLEFLEDRIKGRKWRLFMCACGRRCFDQMPGAACREAVAVGEAYADGEAADDAMITIASAALAEAWGGLWDSRAGLVAVEIASLGGDDLFEGTVRLINFAAAIGKSDVEYAIQADFIRDIFGNPFRPATFSAEWRTDTAIALARQMYEAREFSAMPILADALQDARCDHTDILSHCRNTAQVHVRGCWVVDLVLGKQ
jgi:hypothetical protein